MPKETSLETLLPIETMLNRWDIRLEVSLCGLFKRIDSLIFQENGRERVNNLY